MFPVLLKQSSNNLFIETHNCWSLIPFEVKIEEKSV